VEPSKKPIIICGKEFENWKIGFGEHFKKFTPAQI
jgi:hypothetical protein